VVSATRSKLERAGDRLAGWTHQVTERWLSAQSGFRESGSPFSRLGEMVRFGPGVQTWRTRLAAEPSAVLFRKIRLRLTLWYTGVLATALLILGVALYLSVSHALLSPVDDALHQNAQTLTEYVQSDPGFFQVCQGQISPFADPEARSLRDNAILAACYGESGTYVSLSGLSDHYTAQLKDAALVSAALRSGAATDTVNLGPPLGRVRLYAVLVPGGGGVPFTIVETAQEVGRELDALHTLLTLLIVLGVVALVVAAAGGSFLADKALAPARIAYARQRDFIADASHELRTPLTMLRADAEVLLRSSTHLDPEDAEILHDIVDETAHMSALADNMLNLARLDSGEMPLEQDVVDLSALATEIGRRMTALAAERGLSVHVVESTPVLVVADRLLLEQTILILADNAVKYNRPGGEVTIRVERQGDRALLTMHDTGIGIAAEHLPHLGERFYRVDKARSREMGGAGLGVSIARSIARRHGGSLDLVSQPGEGTTATLSLPAAG
jgi:signal transduction histidine kinase